MKGYKDLAHSVRYEKRGENFVVAVKDQTLIHLGTGRSACAFRILESDKVIKIYYPQFSHLAKEEAEIYKKLESIPSFPLLYEAGDNYIVIDYIEGQTLFQCLTRGDVIDQHVIMEIDQALLEVSRRHLNPSDIHLHNLILTPQGKIMIIDPARFNQQNDCNQWNDLKAAYHKYYTKRLFPKRMPAVLLDSIRLLYKRKLIKI
ncbi:serine/threonine protein kinase [Alkalicoccus daliensis]|uniref:Serine/threonine protein kinase n=1 Tax=Alkalicoccus daliensis TaxID=745820 RepID=A0A1H0FXS7_9BACI|nr:serine/threonine protein kinase [Alkalicoccus daliensis]SDN99498.1 hypothetical protein SAMN04488053_105146 [Alkalicoccus daliensis]